MAEEHRQLIDIAALRPHPRNYNRHSPEQVAYLAESLKQFQQRKPLTTWRNIVLTGHGVFEAAKLLGWSKIWIEPCPDEWTEIEALAWMAADNELARLAEPDNAQLAAILEESRNADAELLAAIGYSDAEFQALLEEVGAAEKAQAGDTEPQIDRAEELREKWGVQSGQLWQLGEHRLICGDCTDSAVVARVLNGEKPALMVTDPPYGVNYDPNWRNEAAEAGFLSFAPQRTGMVTNDDRIDWSDAYALFPGDVAYTWSPGGDHVILTGVGIAEGWLPDSQSDHLGKTALSDQSWALHLSTRAMLVWRAQGALGALDWRQKRIDYVENCSRQKCRWRAQYTETPGVHGNADSQSPG